MSTRVSHAAGACHRYTCTRLSAVYTYEQRFISVLYSRKIFLPLSYLGDYLRWPFMSPFFIYMRQLNCFYTEEREK